MSPLSQVAMISDRCVAGGAGVRWEGAEKFDFCSRSIAVQINIFVEDCHNAVSQPISRYQ
jgi:hypothetical protein